MDFLKMVLQGMKGHKISSASKGGFRFTVNDVCCDVLSILMCIQDLNMISVEKLLVLDKAEAAEQKGKSVNDELI